jgi:hypothetical protein
MRRACHGCILNKERAMADQDRNEKSQRGDRAADDELSDSRFDPQHQKNNEWLRDQVGEDHNLSGSSTYHTLPDQPEEGERARSDENHSSDQSDQSDGATGDDDAQRRQSNR